MRSLINRYLREYGAVFGICGAERLDDTRYGTFTPFVKSDIEARVNPCAILPGAKSIIVVGLGYSVPEYTANDSGKHQLPSNEASD